VLLRMCRVVTGALGAAGASAGSRHGARHTPAARGVREALLGAGASRPCRPPRACSAACYQGGYDVARVLLEKGRADVHAAGKECKSTPLQFAALSGNIDLVKLLLKYQGKVNYQNAAGKTAVHFAAVGGHLDVIRLLLASGASCQLTDDQGRTARDYAHEKGQRDATRVGLNPLTLV